MRTATTTYNAGIGVVTSGYDFGLFTNNTTRMTITSAGNVGIGTSNPQMPLSVQANTGNGAIRLIGTSNASSNNAGIYWYDSNDSTFNGYLGNFSGSFDIYNHRSTPMVFSTAGTERMRITSGGDVGIGTSGTSISRLVIAGKDTTSSNYSFIATGSGGTTIIAARNDGAVFLVGPYPFTTASGANMWLDSSGVIQRNVSSIKYKTDVQDYDKGLAELMKLRPVSYLSKSEIDSPKRYAGMIAEELFELGFTEYVNLDENGEPDSISYASMVTILTKSIQELNERLNKAGL
jgi:hypothetical protein